MMTDCCEVILEIKTTELCMTINTHLQRHSCTTANIQLGFIENGMIDRESKSQADLKGILKALQRTTSLAEENMLINSFPRLYEEHCKFGMII
jgi:hypothetical protein